MSAERRTVDISVRRNISSDLVVLIFTLINQSYYYCLDEEEQLEMRRMSCNYN